MTEAQLQEEEANRKGQNTNTTIIDGEKPAHSSNYKKEKEQILRTNFDDETNWNYLFMNQDTVATSMAK